MRMIKYSDYIGEETHGIDTFQNLEARKLEAWKLANDLMETESPDHVVYAAKYYGEDHKLERVAFYLKPVSEEEMDRIAGIKNAIIYAIHNRGKTKTQLIDEARKLAKEYPDMFSEWEQTKADDKLSDIVDEIQKRFYSGCEAGYYMKPETESWAGYVPTEIKVWDATTYSTVATFNLQ